MHGRAALGDVPRRRHLGEARVAVIGAGLRVEGVAPKANEEAVDEDPKDGEEEVHDEHDSFDQEEEHGEHRDDDVVVGDAARLLAICTPRKRGQDKENTQLAPHKRILVRSAVRHGVDRRLGIRVEAVVIAIPPQAGAIEVGLGDGEEGERGDREGELDSEERPDGLHGPPAAGEPHVHGGWVCWC